MQIDWLQELKEDLGEKERLKEERIKIRKHTGNLGRGTWK